MRILERIKTEPDWSGAVADVAVPCGSVLVVDDEPNIRFTFRTALESAGFRVDEAPSGAAALERLGRTSCDVVLLDLRMPGVGGMEVLQRIRDEGNDVPVVIVTAHGTIPDAVAAMKLGAIDFLSKPITPDALRRVVSEVVERHAPVGPEPRSLPEPSAHPTVVTVWPPLIDLTAAKFALNRRELDRAALLLDEALNVDPGSAEALTLKGVLLEGRGQDHAAYQAYKKALTSDPNYAPARDNMERYCERFGLDAANPRINPAAGT
ncbi:MAG: response regulator [Isosphaeraceae bacterium]|nr:response regulator [Isosphaeraceae bacterium]